MWLVGVVVSRYIDFLIILLILTPLVLYTSFFCSSIPTSLIIFKGRVSWKISNIIIFLNNIVAL